MQSSQRKYVIAIVATLSLVLAFTGCADPTNSNTNPVTYLPVLAPGGGVSAGSINTQAVTDAADTSANIRYYASAPLVYNFAENSLGVGAGDTYVSTNDVFGAVTFTISESDGVITYTGQNTDDSIRVTATYNTATQEIGYEQILYLEDAANILDPSTAMKLVVYTSFSDIALAEDGSFVGPIDAVVFSDSGGLGFQASAGDDAEVFHGKIDGTNIGTGYAIGKGVASFDQDPATPLPAGTGKPTTAAEFVDLDAMSTYITEVTPEGFVSAAGGARANGAIFWRIGTNDAQQDEADPAAFPPDFSGNGLSGWAAVTSLKN